MKLLKIVLISLLSLITVKASEVIVDDNNSSISDYVKVSLSTSYNNIFRIFQ